MYIRVWLHATFPFCFIGSYSVFSFLSLAVRNWHVSQSPSAKSYNCKLSVEINNSQLQLDSIFFYHVCLISFCKINRLDHSDFQSFFTFVSFLLEDTFLLPIFDFILVSDSLCYVI